MDEAPTTIAMPVIPVRGYDSPPAPVPPEFPHITAAPLYVQAIQSVQSQTMRPAGGVMIAADLNHEGAAATRQRALDMVTTEFVSFLDDDDLLYPNHVDVHWWLLREHHADVAYSWFTGNRPFPQSTHRGRQWDPKEPHHITMCITVRTEMAKAVGFSTEMATPDCMNEDWFFITGLNELGARFIGTDEVTFHYRLHGANTSGSGKRW